MGLQALAQPQTPTKRRPEEELRETFFHVSENYNLGLILSDKPQSPSRLRQGGTQGDRIYYGRFRPLFFSDDLPQALAAFRKEAIAVSQKWVHKPLADQDALPMVTGLPSASSEQERHDLVELLYKVLGRYIIGRTPVSSFNSKLGDSAPSDRTPSKRPRPRDHVVAPKSPPKKARSSSDTSGGHVSVPDREGADAVAESPADATERPNQLKRTSAHSSRDSFRTADIVFSQEVPLSQATVTTIEASSQEKRRLPPPPAPSTQDSFPASSDFELKMLESFYREESDEPCLPGSGSSDLDFSDIGQSTLAELDKSASKTKARHAPAATMEFETRLNNVWPVVPDCLSEAPLPIVWEILRVCLFSGVASREFQVSYEESWIDQDVMWRVLKSHPLLRGKALPERSRAEAWAAAFDNFQTLHRVVVFTASLEFSSSADRGSVFTLQLDPLRLERPHRLNRRFGSDRFMEIIIPTLDAKNLPSHFRNIGEAESILRHWASQRLHYFIGRAWSGFFIRPYRNNNAKEVAKDQKDQKDSFNPVYVSMKHRFYLFAEDGDDFSPSLAGQLPSKGEPFTAHTRATKWDMIEWLLQISNNMDQPVTKLFSRIVLGLSRTDATAVLEKSQIKIRKRDRLSPTGNVMNDGIGRMSQSLARKIRAKMGSFGNLTGFQGRIGSAKGFWIIDIQDDTDRDWIILYPSQRKWKCDFTDEEHRTFEVRSEVNPLKSANLNNQFLPILQDRAKDPKGMKSAISNILERSLCKEMEEQRMAIQDPCRLRLWVQNNSTSSLREARLKSGQIPFVGGLPKNDEDRINFLLDGGFDPRRLRMLWELTFKLRKDRCEEMKSRMNIRIGRSTYAFMVVDFWGLLDEGEIHLGFSSNFQDDDSRFSETYLHGMDVLVARSPAHYTSDIQKVKAVFKPELGPLKDVVVFPSKGNVALADKLSGGDYDGDIAWVCWDPDIVGNFVNADVPACPDLFKEGVLTKQAETYSDLALQHGTEASSKFFDAAFQFNMQSSLLGLCTNFKERLGYQRRSVGDEAAVRLSTLLSNLVDQAKQGIRFTNTDWIRFRNHLLKGKAEPPQPRYKSDSCPGIRKFPHIIDHLKFSVLIPIIERELAILSNDKTKPDSLLVPWDKDLVRLYDLYNEIGQNKPRIKSILQKLINDLDALYSQSMNDQARGKDVPFEIRMQKLYEDFHAIQPKKLSGTIERILTRGGTGQDSEWSLLKASVMFKKFYMQGVTWWIAGRQLQHLKGIMTTEGTPTGGALALVRPQIYAALRPDKSFIQALVLEDVVHSGGDVEEVEDSVDNDNEI
ncbi:RNA polymerase-like protein [Apiospora marii]|uniref:RNA-dependent RNA polymerase n=1 Tax=Apiospora marii TaxID=335849 RepID=A0ABR1RDY2_9PEZI